MPSSQFPQDTMVGRRYGKLLVESRALKNPLSLDKRVKWLCLCDCGNTHVVAGIVLRAGKTSSCGCAKTDRPDLIKCTCRCCSKRRANAKRHHKNFRTKKKVAYVATQLTTGAAKYDWDRT